MREFWKSLDNDMKIVMICFAPLCAAGTICLLGLAAWIVMACAGYDVSPLSH